MKILLRNVKAVNVFTESIDETNILIEDDRIIGVGKYYTENDADETEDLKGKYVAPGFIDGHIHIESTMMVPAGLANAVLPHGTTTVITDPHEIANVCGVDGIKYMLEMSEGIPLTVYVMLPSCVPATPFDEAGATLYAKDLRDLYSYDRVLGLAEMMNYPGVLFDDKPTHEKIDEALEKGKCVDGHAPFLSGRDLDKYTCKGISSDHECSTFEEALEKLSKGQWIMIREGSAAKNLEALSDLLDAPFSQRVLLVTDDRNPADIISEGHIDNIVRRAISLGKDPVKVIKAASFNAASRFGIKNLGAIAPGYKADLLVFDDINDITVEEVYKNGKLTVKDSKVIEFKCPVPDRELEERVLNSFRLDKLSKEDFFIAPKGNKCRVIKVIRGQILTDEVIETIDFETNNGVDITKDLCKLAVIERHNNTGHKGIGFIQGIGLKKGALAASVSHDSHNLIVIGTNDSDMAFAANAVREMGGGMVCVADETILADVKLPIAGLMSNDSAKKIAEDNRILRLKAVELGINEGIEPFMNMAFVSLPVIPSLKMSTTGLVDVNKFMKTDLFV